MSKHDEEESKPNMELLNQEKVEAPRDWKSDNVKKQI